jgi:hypothetical protein
LTSPAAESGLPPPTSRWLLLVLLAFAAAAMATGFAPPSEINGDTSWLITVVERLRNGERAYIDVIETNPPMSFLIYWPAVAFAGAVGVSPETMVYVMAGLVIALSLGLIHMVVRRHFILDDGGAALVLAGIAMVYIVMPAKTFTQREHMALMLLLPTVFCLAARSTGARPAFMLAAACGVIAGVGAAIKPHFVLAVTLPAFTAAAARRDWRMLLAPEALIAGVVCIGYAAAWVAFYPAFFELPMFMTTNSYRLDRYRFREVIADHIWLVAGAAVVVLAGLIAAARKQPAVTTLGAAVIAFLAAHIEQGKGFAYHLYPVLGSALILVLFAMALPGPIATGVAAKFRAMLVLLGVLSAAFFSWGFSMAYPDSRELRQAIAAVKQRPSLIILTFDIAINFPLARRIEARWASRLQSTWASNSAGHALRKDLSDAQRALTLRTITLERELITQDVAQNRPDVIVFDGEFMLDHMRGSAEFRAAFDGLYAQAGSAEAGRFLIYRRVGS